MAARVRTHGGPASIVAHLWAADAVTDTRSRVGIPHTFHISTHPPTPYCRPLPCLLAQLPCWPCCCRLRRPRWRRLSRRLPCVRCHRRRFARHLPRSAGGGSTRPPLARRSASRAAPLVVLRPSPAAKAFSLLAAACGGLHGARRALWPCRCRWRRFVPPRSPRPRGGLLCRRRQLLPHGRHSPRSTLGRAAAIGGDQRLPARPGHGRVPRAAAACGCRVGGVRRAACAAAFAGSDRLLARPGHVGGLLRRCRSRRPCWQRSPRCAHLAMLLPLTAAARASLLALATLGGSHAAAACGGRVSSARCAVSLGHAIAVRGDAGASPCPGRIGCHTADACGGRVRDVGRVALLPCCCCGSLVCGAGCAACRGRADAVGADARPLCSPRGVPAPLLLAAAACAALAASFGRGAAAIRDGVLCRCRCGFHAGSTRCPVGYVLATAPVRRRASRLLGGRRLQLRRGRRRSPSRCSRSRGLLASAHTGCAAGDGCARALVHPGHGGMPTLLPAAARGGRSSRRCLRRPHAHASLALLHGANRCRLSRCLHRCRRRASLLAPGSQGLPCRCCLRQPHAQCSLRPLAMPLPLAAIRAPLLAPATGGAPVPLPPAAAAWTALTALHPWPCRCYWRRPAPPCPPRPWEGSSGGCRLRLSCRRCSPRCSRRCLRRQRPPPCSPRPRGGALTPLPLAAALLAALAALRPPGHAAAADGGGARLLACPGHVGRLPRRCRMRRPREQRSLRCVPWSCHRRPRRRGRVSLIAPSAGVPPASAMLPIAAAA